MRSPVSPILPFAALIAIAAWNAGAAAKPTTPPLPANGPAADYPVIIGEPFTVEGTTYTPADRLNWDEAGYASPGAEGGSTVSGAHKTLPLPSYAEVTSLDSGKTILIRLERRGPMSNDFIIELSPGAAAQLGLVGAGKVPVRVRRVNPPEQERAMLRGGGQAPSRMDTPKGLLGVLLRKLDTSSPKAVAAPGSEPASIAAAGPAAGLELTSPPIPEAKPIKSESKSATTSEAKANLVVQVATFSSEANAKTAANKLGGKVNKAGKFWLARLGPFTARAAATAALAKARAAGYSDARIQRAD